jgi:hypothetical protein
MYQFILWLVPTLENFPRSQKFLLGDRLQTEAMAVLDCLIDATYSHPITHKSPSPGQSAHRARRC